MGQPLMAPGLDAAHGRSQDITVPGSCQSVQPFVVDTVCFGVLISSKRKMLTGLSSDWWRELRTVASASTGRGRGPFSGRGDEEVAGGGLGQCQQT